ncbi:MAG: 50S ribosomal protein L13 [Planctomycetota bacterium]|nr:50S ribosomal protein L13 [Planctomycetota bacterium]MDA1137061.1 50S ribosomal protein L13 [Planctomycetota bacterium]
MKTITAKKNEVEQKWLVVDATDVSLGRMSARISRILQGKHKPIYTPHVDTGDFVIVINCKKVGIQKKKLTQKIYHRYTGHIGGLREANLQEMFDRHPDDVIRLAVRGMLPKTKLGRQMLTKLKIYPGPEHPHEAQQPETLKL